MDKALTYWISCIMVILTCKVGPCLAGCPKGENGTWCAYTNWQVLGFDHQIENDSAVIGVDQCKLHCSNLNNCWSFDYSASETTCQYQSVILSKPGVKTDKTTGVDNYSYYCGVSSCPEPEPTPEQEPEPEGEAEMTPEEFWRWLRDEPVWFALGGMGVFILLLVIIIIVLMCRLRPQKSPEKSVYEKTNPTTLDRTFVYQRDNSTESSKDKEAEDEEKRRSKLFIEVP